MNKPAILTTNAVSKAGAVELGQQIKEVILAGYERPDLIYIRLKAIEAAIKQVYDDKEVKAYVLEEAAKNGKAYDLQGNKIEVCYTYTKYDYSRCGCEPLSEINRQLAELDEARKRWELTLKGLPETGLADPQTGEMMYPPSVVRQEGVKVTLK